MTRKKDKIKENQESFRILQKKQEDSKEIQLLEKILSHLKQ